MTSNILELRNFTDSSFRTLVRKCHNNKNLLIVNQEWNSRTGEWETDDRDTMMLPMKFLKPILSYAHLHDTFQILKAPSPKKPKTRRMKNSYMVIVAPLLQGTFKLARFLVPQKDYFKIMTTSAFPLHQIGSKANYRAKKLASFGNFRRLQRLVQSHP